MRDLCGDGHGEGFPKGTILKPPEGGHTLVKVFHGWLESPKSQTLREEGTESNGSCKKMAELPKEKYDGMLGHFFFWRIVSLDSFFISALPINCDSNGCKNTERGGNL
jgi:hypothetical protein